MNRTCWNGLYRENLQGEFNVPFGNFRNPTICDGNNLKAVSKLLQEVTILCVDFEEALSTAGRGDFIFIDAPYVTTHHNNGFLKYNNKIFSWDHQKRLANVVRRLDKIGCYLLISNAHHRSITELYSGFNFSFKTRFSSIAADNKNRKTVTELFIRNY